MLSALLRDFCWLTGPAVLALAALLLGGCGGAASEQGGVCTNGMSNSRRDGENANAAVLVTLRPEDFPDKSTLGGMYWQRSIEQRAFARGGGTYHAPPPLARAGIDRAADERRDHRSQ